MSDGPPGCNDKTGSPHCQPEPVYVDGKARALDRADRADRAGDRNGCSAAPTPVPCVAVMWDD